MKETSNYPMCPQCSSKTGDATSLAKPPRPPITYPPQLSKHAVGRIVITGECELNAEVEVTDYTSFKEFADVTGNTWIFSRMWGAGTHNFWVGQTVDGEYSDSSRFDFTVRDTAQQPVITYPQDDGTLPSNLVYIGGTCSPLATSVEIRNYDGSLLGQATFFTDKTRWAFNADNKLGVKYVKATQFVDNLEFGSSPTVRYEVVPPQIPTS